jgi:hypothetical protein
MREKRLVKITLKTEQLTCLLLLLTLVVMSLSLLPKVQAGMTITSMAPTSGTVGASVQLLSNLTTANGTYQILFDDALVSTGNATANSVNATFTVPEAKAGNHNVWVVDEKTGENASSVFSVSTSYNMTIAVPQAPKQLQEGDSVPISVNITGGESNAVYTANFTVQGPNGVSYVKTVDVAVSTVGSAIVSVSYPGDFSSVANTSLIGDYNVFLNDTLGTGTFSIGLTNSTEYHRTQTVDIKALYKQNEGVNLTITGQNVLWSLNLTADPAGLVHCTNFTVPSNASIGSYMVNITSISAGPTTKTPPDTQNFTVPGFAVNVTARNLAGDSVPDTSLRAYENGSSVSNSTTDANGLAVLILEVGNYTCQAYFKAAQVGERSIQVTDVTSTDLVCNLTNLGVNVIAPFNGIVEGIAEAGIYLTPDNTTFTTDVTGIAVAHSLLPNVTYVLNASRYGMPFNLTKVPQLLVNGDVVPWFNVTIDCPLQMLQVTALQTDGQPINNAVVKTMESVGGLHYEGQTNSGGMITFSSVFGRYDVVVYSSDGIKLNTTTVDLFQDQNLTVYCSLYGLNVSVKVVDYLGQPFSNISVKLQGEGWQPLSTVTGSDGTATFSNVIGGNLEVAVYLNDQAQPTVAEGLTADNSTTVQIRIDRYVLLAGLLVDTSQLAVVIIVALTVIFVILLEVFRRMRFKPKEDESESISKES